VTNRTDTERTDKGSLWPLIGWVIFALSAAAFAIAVISGGLMRAVVLDVASFWPAWAVAIVLALVLWPLSRKGVRRVGAIAPLLLFSWLTGSVGLHFSGWDQLPSAAGDLAGPAVGAAVTAELGIDVSGDLRLGPGTGLLYEVTLVRRGGATGPAEALERRTDENVVVQLIERPDAGWFESRGWEVSISRALIWTLSVEAAGVDVDLATIVIASLAIVADGEVRLASPVGMVPIMIDGGVRLEIPMTASVEVIGPADVPAGWEITDSGFRFTGEGTSTYVVTVAEGATLVVTQW